MRHVFTLSAAALLWLSGPAAAEPIGKLTAVQTEVERAGNPLVAGAGISMGDELASNATGLGMIVFIDQSSAKIGPNSRLVIDDFVFSGGTGRSQVRMDGGITRFYGGRISKTGEMGIRTPHVVLAVRGGIVDVSVSGTSSTAVLRAGRLICRAGGMTTVITKPGFACVSDGAGITTARNTADFTILDSSARIAGTDAPGSTGPGPNADALCSGPGADRLDVCLSRDGALPGGEPGSNATRPDVPRIDVYPNRSPTNPGTTPPPVVIVLPPVIRLIFPKSAPPPTRAPAGLSDNRL